MKELLSLAAVLVWLAPVSGQQDKRGVYLPVAGFQKQRLLFGVDGSSSKYKTRLSGFRANTTSLLLQ